MLSAVGGKPPLILLSKAPLSQPKTESTGKKGDQSLRHWLVKRRQLYLRRLKATDRRDVDPEKSISVPKGPDFFGPSQWAVVELALEGLGFSGHDP